MAQPSTTKMKKKMMMKKKKKKEKKKKKKKKKTKKRTKKKKPRRRRRRRFCLRPLLCWRQKPCASVKLSRASAPHVFYERVRACVRASAGERASEVMGVSEAGE